MSKSKATSSHESSENNYASSNYKEMKKKKINKLKKNTDKLQHQKISAKLGSISKNYELFNFKFQDCKHHNKPIEFLCLQSYCKQKLCSFCIIEHIKQFPEHKIQNFEEMQQKFVSSIKQQDCLIKNENYQFIEQLDSLQEQINLTLFKKINDIKQQIIQNDRKYLDYLNEVEKFQDQINLAKQSNNNQYNYNHLDTLKYLLINEPKQEFYKKQLVVEEPILQQQIQSCLNKNIQIFEGNYNLNSFNPGVPKYLHWFDWQKKTINLFNLVKTTHQIIQLKIDFTIPLFSRSVNNKEGIVYLVGGEKDQKASNDLFSCQLSKLNEEKRLVQKKSMLYHKFDFSICCFKNYLYVICGKNSSNNVVNTCERYNISENKWEKIEDCIIKRYAASCCGLENLNKIFLFGGRTEVTDNMVPEIEVYSVDQDEWNILCDIQNLNLWSPVEVLCTVQIAQNQILIFGGCDKEVKDMKKTYILDMKEKQLKRKKDLLRAHVFICSPVVYGNYVYVLGNQYYHQNKNISRYDIENDKWDIVF